MCIYRWGFLLLLLLGCGPKEPFPVSVSGVVTLDGKRLAAGRISFITPGKVPEIVEIVDGRFQGKVMTGERRVEIAAYRPYQIPAEIPKSMHAQMKDGKENYLPEKYHRTSELTATVKDTGNNEFTFDLAP
jgi:hypothetical protein